MESRNVLAKAILEGNCVAATDGSNKDDEGAQAWLISNREGAVLVRGRGRVPCAKQDASSLRPELAALLAVTTFVEDFVKKEKIGCERSNEITISAVGPPNLGRAQAPYSALSFCLLGKKEKFTRKIEVNYIHHEDEHWIRDDHSIVSSSE